MAAKTACPKGGAGPTGEQDDRRQCRSAASPAPDFPHIRYATFAASYAVQSTWPPSRKDRGRKRAGCERGVRQAQPYTHNGKRRPIAPALLLERELPASFQ